MAQSRRTPPNQDFISGLPEDVKVKILEYLSIDEAVRSSVLSKSWRHTWSNITKLYIKDSRFPSHDSLIGFVNMFFPLHNRSIFEFRLDSVMFCLPSETLGRWISILSQRNIQSIKIVNTFSFSRYQLPSDICSCHSLEIVYLYCCGIDVPSTFTNRWKILSLFSVRMDSDSFERLISNSPSLEKLEIGEPFDEVCLKVRSPNLKDLLIRGNFTAVHLDVPSVLHASFMFYKGNSSNLSSALSAVPNIEKLKLSVYYSEYFNADNSREKRSIKFNNLNDICIFVKVSDHHYVSSALFLFENAPNFRTLFLQMRSTRCENPEVISLFESKLKDGFVFRKLATMHVHGRIPAGDKWVMMFMKFVLLTAPFLKKFV